MFFIHTFSCMESGVLLAMSYDSFVAVYNPLHYTAILTLPCIVCVSLVITLKSVILWAPLPVLLRLLPYCLTNILSHSYCLHPDLIQLPCADTKLNSILGLAIVLATFGLDSLLIVVSYMLILYRVLGVASGEGRQKALNMCVSHICAVLFTTCLWLVCLWCIVLPSMPHFWPTHSCPASTSLSLPCSIPSSTVSRPNQSNRELSPCFPARENDFESFEVGRDFEPVHKFWWCFFCEQSSTPGFLGKNRSEKFKTLPQAWIWITGVTLMPCHLTCYQHRCVSVCAHVHAISDSYDQVEILNALCLFFSRLTPNSLTNRKLPVEAWDLMIFELKYNKFLLWWVRQILKACSP